jgi:ethanolamine utilization protein EutN
MERNHMTVGKVVGTVVTTVKHPILEGYKLLVVQPLDPKGNPAGSTMIALDTVQAGVGDTVLVIEEGNSARLIIGDSMAPVRTVVAGIVDSATVTPGKPAFVKEERKHGR